MVSSWCQLLPLRPRVCSTADEVVLSDSKAWENRFDITFDHLNGSGECLQLFDHTVMLLNSVSSRISQIGVQLNSELIQRNW